MKPKNTLMLVVVLAVLATAYWATGFLNKRAVQQVQEAKAIFTFDEKDVENIELKRVDGPLCAAAREADGAWKFSKPNATIQPMPQVWDRMARALAALKNQRVVHTADGLTPEVLKSFGLAEPRLTFNATVKGQPALALVFGSPEPTQVNRFARLNDGPVMLVNEKEFFELDRDLDFLRYRFLVDNREAPLLRMEFTRIWTGREARPEHMTEDLKPGDESVKIIVERESATAPWRMKSPVDAAADQAAVDAMAKELQFAMGDGYVDTPADLADYGLKPANARVTLKDSTGGAAQTVYLGDADKSGNGRLFAKREDKDAVFTLEGTLIAKLPRTPEAFRERRLLTQQAKDIVRVDYTSNASKFSLVRGADDAWAVDGIEQKDVSQERTNAFFQQLKTAALQAFIEGPAVDSAGLEQPDVAITVHLKDEAAPREIRLKANGADAAMFYARQDTGVSGMLTAEHARGIMVTPESFRSLALLNFSRAEATKITFVLDTKPYAFEKVHGLWVVRQPENYRLSNQSDAETILGAFSRLTASSNAPVAPIVTNGLGLEKPVLTISITTAADDGKETMHGALSIGSPAAGRDNERYARLAGQDAVYTVKQEVLDKVRDALHGVIANPAQ